MEQFRGPESALQAYRFFGARIVYARVDRSPVDTRKFDIFRLTIRKPLPAVHARAPQHKLRARK